MLYLNYLFIGCGIYKMFLFFNYYEKSNNEYDCIRVCGVCMILSFLGYDKEFDFLKNVNIIWKCSDSYKSRGIFFRKFLV